MAEDSIPPEIRQMSFEQALEELQQIVARLEKGEGQLDQAIDSYKRGSELKLHCENKLREAKQQIEKISLGPDGDVETEPLEID